MPLTDPRLTRAVPPCSSPRRLLLAESSSAAPPSASLEIFASSESRPACQLLCTTLKPKTSLQTAACRPDRQSPPALSDTDEEQFVRLTLVNDIKSFQCSSSHKNKQHDPSAVRGSVRSDLMGALQESCWRCWTVERSSSGEQELDEAHRSLRTVRWFCSTVTMSWVIRLVVLTGGSV